MSKEFEASFCLDALQLCDELVAVYADVVCFHEPWISIEEAQPGCNQAQRGLSTHNRNSCICIAEPCGFCLLADTLRAAIQRSCRNRISLSLSAASHDFGARRLLQSPQNSVDTPLILVEASRVERNEARLSGGVVPFLFLPLFRVQNCHREIERKTTTTTTLGAASD